MTRRSLVVVDPQYDFMPGGALPVSGGDEIVPVVNELFKARWDLVAVSQDWHPADHSSFLLNGGAWPIHCVANTRGARVHDDLAVPDDALVVTKGASSDRDAYSAFCGGIVNLVDELLDAYIDAVYVCGLATDYCVKATVLDSVAALFETHLVLDACRGVNVAFGVADRAVEEMVTAGAVVTLASEVTG